MRIFHNLVFGIMIFCFSSKAQESKPVINTASNPKLIVGIVVDQMRYDYLTRFYKKYGDGGFKRIVENGFNCKNHHINYIPTTTAPGHASIYTGATPQYHGIVGNSWYDRTKGQKIYCVLDDKVSPVGTSSAEGKKSPSKLLITTIADQNRLHSQMRGKTISISIKDRAAVLSGGHTANAAYWFRGKNHGSWISSSYYMDKLPSWVIDFNASNRIDSYLKTWDTLSDIKRYTESGDDDTKFERGFKGKEKPIFPYDLQKLKSSNGGYDILRQTPFGNSLTVDFAIASINGEQLGKDEHIDFLNISFSTTDYIGHNFGVNSKEIEDTYIRLDQDIARLMNVLDTTVGQNSYVLFLTSDHGATQVPTYLKSVNVPSGYFKEASVRLELQEYLYSIYKKKEIITQVSNNQVFLNNKLINEDSLDQIQIQREVSKYLLRFESINLVYTREQLMKSDYNKGIPALIKNGFHQKRSGDVFYTLTPSTIAYSKTGSSHGSGFNYDTHIPLLFYGMNIKTGQTYRRTEVTDISVTLSFLIDVALPNSASGKVITEVLK
ncbi:alkaline phosphatase PafA [Aquimarina gracilis]|uniref:Alkaline phosphatase PafA n=1 Tax=Aquimarina gracilis TaxID=874422 RepID=A0ABU5ZVM5_9FLAO|nr:alkaline phosphatase PafA [Aquimarina gracilis]MEB3345915.1 alkaline phosphatase PafA [Aquimarina gracilis]